MDRGERRRRTENKIQRRTKQWNVVISDRIISGTSSIKPGHARKRSHFDCGRTRCPICRRGPGRPRQEDGE